MSKLQFKCTCGHEEDAHNFDPGSAFFMMCMTRFVLPRINADGSAGDPEDIECRCNEYIPDNLRYLEERYAKRFKTHSRLHR